MDSKSLRVEIKSADEGTVSAVFSTFNVIDSDQDVTPPGAFEDGAEVLISAYGHKSWDGVLPVGKGVIRTTKNEAVLEGRFFLDTTAGRDTFAVVKELGGMGQWSYGFDVVDSEYGEHDGQKVRILKSLKVHEVSPVLIGAGVNTRTLSAKSNQRFADEAQSVLADLSRLTDRAADILVKRQEKEKGKGLGTDSSELMERIEAELKRLAGLLPASVPTPEGPDPELEREFLRFMSRNQAA